MDYNEFKKAPEPGFGGERKLEEHIAIAMNMGNEIIKNFNPLQQNDMVRTIKQVIAENRLVLIETAEKDLAYLRDSFQNL